MLEAVYAEGTDGILKRFVGLNAAHQYVECDCTNLPRVIHTGLSNLNYAHRIGLTAPTLKEARRLLHEARRRKAATAN
jgi:hypothetical protein